MLDAPVFLRGKMVGVVCHEHTGSPPALADGKRSCWPAPSPISWRWCWRRRPGARPRTPCGSSATPSRARSPSAPVSCQTSEANLRALVDFSPAAMVVTRLAPSNTVMLANRRATAMFEVPLDEVEGGSAPDFWVNIGDRVALPRSHLERAKGRVEELETQLRTPAAGACSGRVCRRSGCGWAARKRCSPRSSTSPRSVRPRTSSAPCRRPTIR